VGLYINKTLLQSYIVKFDGNQLVLARAMGLSLSRLNAKINETKGAEFKQSEIIFMRDRYHLTDHEVCNIFFAKTVS